MILNVSVYIVIRIMLQILYEVVDVRRLSTLYVPGTREVKVTWLNQDHTITDTQLAAIFPDAIINSTDDCGWY